MPLPGLIEIVPREGFEGAEVTVPGSKSITNRSLILAALGSGETILKGALWSEDTQVMVAALQALGFMVNVAAEASEPSNRTITVYGKGGTVPRGGTESGPLELYVANAGTAARFLSAFVCLGEGVYRLVGSPRMHERPQAALFKALAALGYRIESLGELLPATIFGGGSKPGHCRVSIEQSSQFASALLLCAPCGGWDVEVEGENAEESPYVRMTVEMLKVFPRTGGLFEVEADASSGSYFLGAGLLMGSAAGPTRFRVEVQRWPTSGWQADQAFPEVIQRLFLGADTGAERDPKLRVSRNRDLADSIMTAITMAPLAPAPIEFLELGRLRLQECERVAALRTELSKCGAEIKEQGDTLAVWPSRLRGAEIETYHDHRMAMCFATLGSRVPGMRLRNPGCVRKTFPGFLQKFAAAPPHGLGLSIRDVASGRLLCEPDLFAD